MGEKLDWQIERDKKVSELQQAVDDGVKQIMEGDAFRQWLTVASRFHKYSWGNVFLIAWQKPDATLVAGFRTWQKLGRQVRKGEKGIRILAPAPIKKQLEDGSEDKIMLFKPVSVFDISQTDGDDIPTPPTPVEVQGEKRAVAEASHRIAAWLVEHGYEYRLVKDLPVAGRYWPHDKRIELREGMPANQHGKTLFHELAHALAGHGGDETKPEREAMAESAAFIACGTLGLDTSAYSLPYIAGWAGEMKVVKLVLHSAMKLAQQMLDIAEVRPQVAMPQETEVAA